MNDEQQERAPEHATTDLPLQAQLMGSLALVLVLSAIAGVIGYATFDSSSLENSARAKSTMYASNLTQQVYGAVAMGDVAAAEEAIAPLVTDRNVYGVAVYAPGGRRLAGHGNFPASLAAGEEVKLADDRVLLTLRDVPVGYGSPGRLYLALSTEHIVSARFRAAQFPAMTTAVVLLFSILLALAHSFSVMMSEVVRMFEERRQMERTEKQRLEKLVSERTHELERGREQYRLVVEGTQAIPFALDVEDGHFEYIGPQGPQRLGFSEDTWKQIGFLDRLMPRDRNGAVRSKIDDSKSGNFEIEATVLTQDEKRVDLRWVASCEQSENTGQHKVLRGMMLDVTDQRRLENELAQAQKLESVGRLAAGVAHEINTPVQFVSDSVQLRARGHGRPLGDRRQVPRAAQRHAKRGQPRRERGGRGQGGGRSRGRRRSRLHPRERAGGARSRARRPRARGGHRAVDEGIRASGSQGDGAVRSQPGHPEHAGDRLQRIQIRRGRRDSRSATCRWSTAMPARSTRWC